MNSILHKSIQLIFIYILYLILSLTIMNAQGVVPLVVRQLDIYEPYQQVASRYGQVVVQVPPHTDLFFLNIFAMLPSSPTYQWIVQNIPMHPFINSELISYMFDLTELGIDEGDRVELINVLCVTNNYFLEFPNGLPLTAFVPFAVIPFDYIVGADGMLHFPTYEVPLFEQIPLTFTPIVIEEIQRNLSNYIVYRGCNVANIDLDSANHPPTTEYAGDKNACGPAGAANSLDWLEKNHPEIKTNKTLRKKLEELSKAMKRQNNEGVSTEDFIKGKLQFIADNKLPISVKFQSAYTDRVADIESPDRVYKQKAKNQNANKTNPNRSVISWSWLYQEMKDGEDVEIGMDFYEWDGSQWVHKGAHIATVTGASQIGGIRRIWLKDDANQIDSGGTEQNALTWETIGETQLPILKEWSKGNKATVVSDLISESYDPNIRYDLYDFQPRRLKFKDPFETETKLCSFGATYYPNTDVYFINFVGRLDSSSGAIWLGKNIPKMPFDKEMSMETIVDLGELGNIDFDRLTHLDIAIIKTIEPWTWSDWGTFDPKLWNSYELTAKDEIKVPTWSRDSFFDITYRIDFPTFTTERIPKDSVYRGCKVPNIDLDSTNNKPSADGYSGDWGKCAPASAANSLEWLENTFPKTVKSNINHREKLKELSRLWDKYLKEQTNGWQKSFVQAKLDFIAKYKLPIKVKIQGTEFKKGETVESPNPIGKKFGHKAQSHNASDSTYPTFAWLMSELKKGEDVEMSYIWKDTVNNRSGAHMAVVTGAVEVAGQKYIYFKDDRRQDTAGLRRPGDQAKQSGEEVARWRTNADGVPFIEFGSGIVRYVNFVMSESYDPSVNYTIDEGSVEFNQMKFISPFKEDTSANINVSFKIAQLNTLQYVNIQADPNEITNNDSAYWVVKNLPLLPFNNEIYITTSFDYRTRHDMAKNSINNIRARVIVTDHTIDNDWFIETFGNEYYDSKLMTQYTVGKTVKNIGDGSPREQEAPAPAGNVTIPVAERNAVARDTIHRGCTVPNIDLDSTRNNPTTVKGYAGDMNACGPAAAANSLHWLEENNPNIASTGTTLREKLTELSRLMRRSTHEGVTTEQLVEGKLAYIDKYKLPISVKVQSRWWKKDSTIASSDTTNGVGYGHRSKNKNDSNFSWPTWSFLVNEMRDGEDVEILYGIYDSSGNRTGGHWVTVTGTVQSGANRGIYIKDDADQMDSGLGRTITNRDSTGEEYIPWTTTTTGIPIILRYGDTERTRRVESIVSESYDSTVQFTVNENIQFNQLDMIEPEREINSDNGTISMLIHPTNKVMYGTITCTDLNFRTQTTTYMAIMPFDKLHRLTKGISLKPFKNADDERIDSILYNIIISDRLIVTPGAITTWTLTKVGSMKHVVGDGSPQTVTQIIPTESKILPIPIPLLPIRDTVYRGCNVPNLDLDSASNPPSSTTGYAGDKNACGPVAAANSLQWLENVNKEINSKTTHRKKLEELSKFMNRTNNDGVYTKDFIEAKLKFIQKYNLPIEVKFQSFRFNKDSVLKSKDDKGNELKAQNKNTKDRGYPTWEFLVQEMKDGEDVELEYGTYNSSGTRIGGHWVTVTGTIRFGGVRGVYIKDDLRQDSSGLGDAIDGRNSSGEELIEWDTTSTGIPILRRWGTSNRRIESIVSESYKKPTQSLIKDIKLFYPKFKFIDRTLTSPIELQFVSNNTQQNKYLNIVAKEKDDTTKFWIIRNFTLPVLDGDSKRSIMFDYVKIKAETPVIQAIGELDLSVNITDDVWTQIQPASDWQTVPINNIGYNIGKGLTDASIGASILKPTKPDYRKSDNPDEYEKASNAIFIDLNSADDDPLYEPGYPGDANAAAPAASAASMHYLDINDETIQLSTVPRQTHELLSMYMGRSAENGVKTEDIVKGMLAFIDSVKVPVSVRYLASTLNADSILSPDMRFNHLAKVITGFGNNPVFDAVKFETLSRRDIVLCLQWIAPDGTLVAGHVVNLIGYSNAANVNQIWLYEDTDENAAGGGIIYGSTWETLPDGKSILSNRGIGDTLCFIVGIITQGYDENVKFEGTNVEDLSKKSKPSVSIIRNPSEIGESISIEVHLPISGNAKIGIFDLNGKLVMNIADGWFDTGSYKFIWNGLNRNGTKAAPGTYILMINTEKGQSTTAIIKW